MNQVIQAKLLSHPDRPRFAYLRELSGRQELALSASAALSSSPAQDGANNGFDSQSVVKVLCEVLVDWPGAAVGPGVAAAMSISDRDRVLAALYGSCFGDTVECLAGCLVCGKPYEVSFELSEMLREQESAWPVEVHGPDAEGRCRFRDFGFRLPTVADEVRVATLAPEPAREELLRACHVSGSCDPATLELLVEGAGAVLAATLDSACGNCGQPQPVEFDLQSFFLRALQRERALLIREVHCLAVCYRWGHAEILDLPRSLRREYARLVLSERGPRREVAA